MHGMNDIVLASGLAVDYQEISKQAEKLRAGMTGAKAVEIDFVVAENKHTLRLELTGRRHKRATVSAMAAPMSLTFRRARSISCRPAPAAHFL